LGLGVDSLLSPRLPLEVFDDVRDVGRLPVEAGRLEGAIQEPAGRTHERTAEEVILVSRLLADEHHVRPARPFAEDGLGSPLPEVAGAAPGGDLPEPLQGGMRGHQRRRRLRRHAGHVSIVAPGARGRRHGNDVPG
jgi:hypothetical protein